jgi:hypothetical protein
MKKFLFSISLLILTLIGFSQAETAEMSDYEKYRLQKDIKEHSILYDTTYVDTVYVFDTVYIKDNKKSATVINNYYEDEDYGYDRPDVRFNLCFGYNWFYSPWYSWYYDPWFYDPWYYSYYSYWYSPWYYPRYYYPYNYYGWNDWGYGYHNYPGHHNYSTHNNNNYTYGPRGDSRHNYNTTRPTSITSHTSTVPTRVNKTIYVDKDTRDVIRTTTLRNNSISSRTMNTTRPTTTDRSPYTKVLKNKSNDMRTRTYTPSYRSTNTYIKPTYNSGTNRSSTTYRSSTPTKSTNSYSRPTSTYRSSGSSGSSTYRSSGSIPSRSSYSSGSRPSSGSSTYRSSGSSSSSYRSSGSTPSRSSSSYSGRSPSSGSSHSSSPRK